MAKEEKVSAEQVIWTIRRETRRKYSAEEKLKQPEFWIAKRPKQGL